MESTLEKISSCRYKTKMDKPSGFYCPMPKSSWRSPNICHSSLH